jgi:predicted membrane chloride channel (bestrophin family)
MHNNVTVFQDMLGMCERIFKTPLPLTYTRHASRFLFIWVCALPFAMVGSFGWGTIPLTLFISTLLLGIDEIGVSSRAVFKHDAGECSSMEWAVVSCM